MPPTPPPVGFDEKNAAAYDDRFAKIAALRDALHLQVRAILTGLPFRARVLCVGAGTGLELEALASHFPGWHFTAVEPSAPMMALCERRARERGFADRCVFHLGYLESLPTTEPFDAATCLLVSHFILQRDARQALFSQIAARLHANGWLLNADLSGDPGSPAHARLREAWSGLMQLAGIAPEQIAAMHQAHAKDVAFLATHDLEALITAAGFEPPILFYQALLIRGWMTRKRAP